jgi:hypothetical protein
VQSSWMFKPRFGFAVVEKILTRICNDYLNWYHHGYEWSLTSCEASDHSDWLKLEVYPDGNDSNQYYTETIFSEEPLTAKELAEDMLILLTSGKQACALELEDGSGEWCLADVELSNVLCSLAVEDSNVYSPYADKVFCMHVGTGSVKRPSLLDLLLTQEAA